MIARLIAPYAIISGKIAAPNTATASSAVVNMPDKNGRTLVRQFVVPNNPDTQWQSTARAAFTSISEAYQTLSQAQVEAWQALAATINNTGRLGLDYKLSWTSFFQQVNNYRLQNGAAITLTAPSLGGANMPTAIVNIASDDGSPTQQLEITLADSSPTAGSWLAFRLTRDLSSPNRKARDNEFQYVGASAASIITRDLAGLISSLECISASR
jgi:hypothetical protein